MSNTTCNISVSATAFKPPHKEYESDKRARKTNPKVKSKPVSEFIASEPNHKTLVRFINI